MYSSRKFFDENTSKNLESFYSALERNHYIIMKNENTCQPKG